jgi:hypothetical protein
MTAVGVLSGIKYGFVLLGYFIAVFLVGGVILGIGVAIASGGTTGGDTALLAVGAVLSVIGGLIVYAGVFGVLYKIIADGVKRGIESARGPVPGVERER